MKTFFCGVLCTVVAIFMTKFVGGGAKEWLLSYVITNLVILFLFYISIGNEVWQDLKEGYWMAGVVSGFLPVYVFIDNIKWWALRASDLF